MTINVRPAFVVAGIIGLFMFLSQVTGQAAPLSPSMRMDASPTMTQPTTVAPLRASPWEAQPIQITETFLDAAGALGTSQAFTHQPEAGEAGLRLSVVQALAQEPALESQRVEPRAAASTVVTTHITSDTAWTLAGSPYEVANDIRVAEGVTLTIEPDVEVRFRQYAGLDVRGTLRAVGSAEAPIRFTGTTQEAGWWENIAIQGTSATRNQNSVLDHVIIEYGGQAYGNLYLYQASVAIANSMIRHSGLDGIYGTTGGVAHLTNVSLANNGAEDAGYAVHLIDGSVNPLLASLSAAENGIDAIALGGGTLQGAHLWEQAGLPYHILGDQRVGEGATLTVEPGVEVLFAQYAGLDVRGTLHAVGSAEAPIRFTGTSKQAGWWENITIQGTSAMRNQNSVLDHVTIEYGGQAYGNLYLYQATVPVSNSTLRYSGSDGIYGTTGGVAHLTNVSLTNNGAEGAGYAVHLTDGSVNPLLANLSAAENGIDAIALGGAALQGEHLWEQVGLPYHILNDQRVTEGATLTIEPGVEVLFAQYAGLDVRGQLTAIGTVEAPILFTGTTQESGWWEGIAFQGTTAAPNQDSALDYVTVEYGGQAYGNLYLYQATLPVRHSIIRHSGQDGIYGSTGGVAHLAHTSLTNNAGYAAVFHDGTVDPALSNLVVTGNTFDGIGLGSGALQGDHLWERAAIRYYLTNDLRVATGAGLTIEPGVEVLFAQYAGLDVRGRLTAIGTAEAPILFTGTTKEPGWWENIAFQGTSATPNRSSVLDYVTVEYGGQAYGNLYLYQAGVAITNSIIRQSGSDGIYATTGAGGTVIQSSQLVGNTGYAIRNDRANTPLLASNNWWGAGSGPQVEQNCHPGGTGSVISLNVEYRPYLTDSEGEVSTVAPTAAYRLSVTPQRWFIPADGVTQAEVIITLRDGEGNPIPGREVDLASTLGQAIGGGRTDIQGQARARVSSTTEGEAALTASIGESDPCANTARSNTATITFTEFDPGELTQGGAAPYLNDRLGFTPEPIVQGVPTTITARLTNPNPFPILINGTFGIAQSGIGLAFPPVGSVEDFLIPANSDGVIEIAWVPPLSGHYCVRLDYNWRAAGAGAASVQQSRSSQRNLNVYGGNPTPYGDKAILNKASKYGTYVGALGNGTGEGLIPGFLATILTEWQLTKAAEISRQMGGDPPRQDYTVIAQANPILPPPVPAGNGVSPQLADALNVLRETMAWVNAHGEAAIVSYDRYGGAAAANNLEWASQQIHALNYHKHEMAKRLLAAADALDHYRQVRQADGIADVLVSAQDIHLYQERLRTEGFTQEEIDAAHAVGLSDGEIEVIRQQQIAADPDEQAGSLLDFLATVANTYRELAGNILFPPTFGGSVGGSPGRRAGVGQAQAQDLPPTPMADVPASNNPMSLS